MADTATAEPDLSALTNSPPLLKRKRGGPDSSPDSRRNKRGIPAATMAADAISAAFMENADTAQAAHAAAAAVGVNVSDFSALQQAAAEHSEASDPANASSTAAAALGSMYPTLHIPQSTEETFAAQAGVDTDHHDNSYADVGHDGLSMDTSGVSAAGMHPSNGIRQDQRYGSTPTQKPAVGSEEWHKMRKDNHKEGEIPHLKPDRGSPN